LGRLTKGMVTLGYRVDGKITTSSSDQELREVELDHPCAALVVEDRDGAIIPNPVFRDDDGYIELDLAR
jgi:hypothetical protein